MEVTSVVHEVDVPFDIASGQASGKRQHKPIRIAKLTDQATPKLYAALVANEALNDVELTFWEGASKAPYLTIQLTGGAIVGLKLTSPNNHPCAAETCALFEEIQFTFTKIVVTWTDGGVTATDDWLA